MTLHFIPDVAKHPRHFIAVTVNKLQNLLAMTTVATIGIQLTKLAATGLVTQHLPAILTPIRTVLVVLHWVIKMWLMMVSNSNQLN